MAPSDGAGTVVVVSEDHGVFDGPWEQGFWLRSMVALRSKSNFRRGYRPGENWPAFRRFEQDLGLLLQSALPEGWDLGPDGGPVAARPAVLTVVCASSLLDVPNYPKSVTDAAEGVVFHTDASVAFSGCVGVRSSQPGLLVAFARLPAATPFPQIVDASAQLLVAAAARFEPPAR